MSELRRVTEEVADALDAYTKQLRELKSNASPGKLDKFAAKLRAALEHEKRELDDATGRRYGDNIGLLCTLLAGMLTNGEKRDDAHGTTLALRDELQSLANDDDFWLQQCQRAKAVLNAGAFPRYDDEPPALPVDANDDARVS